MIKHKNVLAIIITFCNSTSNNVNLFFSQQAIFEISPFTQQKVILWEPHYARDDRGTNSESKV